MVKIISLYHNSAAGGPILTKLVHKNGQYTGVYDKKHPVL